MSEKNTKIVEITAKVYAIGSMVWYINAEKKAVCNPVHSMKIDLTKSDDKDHLFKNKISVFIDETASDGKFSLGLVSMEDVYQTKEELINSLF